MPLKTFNNTSLPVQKMSKSD